MLGDRPRPREEKASSKGNIDVDMRKLYEDALKQEKEIAQMGA